MTDSLAGGPKRPSLLGLGCSRIGSFNNPQSLNDSFELIRHALDIGVSLLDTSNIYGQGDSETQIGRAIAGRRDDAFVVTKTGKAFSGKMQLLRPFKPLLRPLLAMRSKAAKSSVSTSSPVTSRRDKEMRQDWRPEAFAPSLEASLRRLKTDYVDGFLLHSPSADILGHAGVNDALAALKYAGKVRHYGVSCDDMACLDAALTMDGLTLLQLPWDVIAALDAGKAELIRKAGIMVHAREVIRQQPGVPALQAVAQAAANPLVDSVLVGTTSQQHLDTLALQLSAQ